MKITRKINTTSEKQRQHKKQQVGVYNDRSVCVEVEKMQEHLDDLQTDRASMEIVFESLKNAFLTSPTAEWDEIDKEVCRAYDDLMAQARQLDRALKRLDRNIRLTEKKIVPNDTAAVSCSDSVSTTDTLCTSNSNSPIDAYLKSQRID